MFMYIKKNVYNSQKRSRNYKIKCNVFGRDYMTKE